MKKDLKGDGHVHTYFFDGDYSPEYMVKMAKDFRGTLKLGGPEAEINSDENSYLLEWFPINKLKSILLYSNNIADKIISKFDISSI
ncbi:hypothetical protein HOK51_08935 [Candidatus Woesearchaeota archaeon]|jgi:hypothetical protein|nr:hypothetical protein [Candidatus Woesearchaeota archaeon]MBT6519953.1 hypothetical protein [Candidatus Woesearchaeota archaeon]MBT7367846.1 hypothetical protein [Candidatus Woesearchaeota archaeon]